MTQFVLCCDVQVRKRSERKERILSSMTLIFYSFLSVGGTEKRREREPSRTIQSVSV